MNNESKFKIRAEKRKVNQNSKKLSKSLEFFENYSTIRFSFYGLVTFISCYGKKILRWHGLLEFGQKPFLISAIIVLW